MTAKRKVCTLSLAALLLAVTPGARAASRTLSLTECLQMALEHNLTLKVTRYNPEIAEYQLSGSYAAYEPTLSLQAGRDHRQTPGGVDEFGRVYAGSESTGDSFGGAVRGLLPFGFQYSLGGGFSDTFGTTPVITPTNIFRFPFENVSGQIAMSELRQPLMRGSWMNAAALAIQLNREALKSSEHNLRLQAINTATAVEQAYYLLIARVEAIAVRQKGLETAQASLLEASRKVEVGAAAPLDKTKAEAEVASRKAALSDAVGQLDIQQRLLKNLLTDDYGSWHDVTIVPAEKLSLIPLAPQRDDSLLKALSLRPELRVAQTELARQNIQIKYDQNQLYPQFDLVGSIGVSAGGVREFSDAFGQIDSFDNPFYGIRAEVIIPLGNRAARNRIKASRAGREQILVQFKQLEQNIVIEVDNAINTVKTSYESSTSAREAARFAQEALAAEQKKLENGKSTTYTVLQYQRDALEAELRAIQAIATYNVALSELGRAEGANLERLNLRFEK